MSELKAERPDYGNWVSARLLYLPAAMSIVLAGISWILPVMSVAAAIFFLGFAYFAYAR